MRSLLGVAVGALRTAGWAIEERVLWPGAELLRRAASVARLPFERFAWATERRLIWPLQERTAGWGLPERTAGAGALAAVALAAGAFGIVLASGSDDEEPVGAAPARVAIAAEPQAPEPAEPVGPALRGVPPKFGVGDGVGVSKAATGDAGASGTTATTVAAADSSGTTAAAGEDAGAAVASSEKPVPAGPVAMKVARRFVEAFVFYEIGERTERARTVFEETAAPRLATALTERPPRLPANGRVPKARVLNLVPGPRRAKAYTVSASLLRVGVTSELRLKMKKRDGAWLVTDVRG